MVAPPLVDRSDERQALMHLLDTVREGMSQTLVIRGEAGIGKTTLLGTVDYHLRKVYRKLGSPRGRSSPVSSMSRPCPPAAPWPCPLIAGL